MATSRFWTNDGGLALNATNLNGLEGDVDKGLQAFSAVNAITTNSWQPNTAYIVGRFILDPNGLVVKVITAHTSGATYDATKFTTPATVGDATVAGYLTNSASATSVSLDAALAGASRTNWVTNPSFAKSVSNLGIQNGTGASSALSWQSGPGADGLSGFARVTWSVGSTGGGGINAGGAGNGTAPIPVTSYIVGDSYTLSGWVRASKAISVSWGGYFRAGASGALAGQGSTTYNLSANTWTRVSRTFTVPATADNFYFYSYQTGTVQWAAGDTYDLDNVLLEKSASLGTYFDGNTDDATTLVNEWNGVPHGSASTQRVVIPSIRSLTPRTGTRPVGMGERYCNVMDFGAKRDNVTDDLDAFMAAQTEAIRLGHCNVYAPGGLGPYRLRSAFRQKSYVSLYGDGMDITNMKLADNAPLDTFVICNDDWSGAATNLRVENLTVDWNLARQADPLYSGEGGARSSCLTFGGVQYGWIKNVKSANAGLHGIDITHGSLDYNYPGDMAWDNTPIPSRYIYVDGCIQTAWGDDGLTTHHSEYLYISNNFAYDARCKGNNNGIELDDGTRHAFVSTSASMHCYGGLEIKAHVSSPAAMDIHVDGYVSIADVRSFNWRHIGHHDVSTDPKSLSARDITANNLVSLGPRNTRGFQEDATPRALCISAFVNVSVGTFTGIGDIPIDGTVADYTGQTPVAVQFMASNVSLGHVNLRGFANATNDVYFSGGQGPVSNCSIGVLNVYKSGKRAIGSGNGVTGIGIGTVHAVAPDTGAEIGIGIVSAKGHAFSDDIWLTGYPIAIQADGNNYSSLGMFKRRIEDAPAGTTSMKDVDPSKDYYFDISAFAACGTDRPAPAATAGGGYFLLHSRLTTDSVTQTLYRNTTTTAQAQYWRVLNYATKVAGAWQQVNITAVAYSAA